MSLISLAGHHHFPGDPCDLVGQRDCREFCRLALEQLDEPGRSVPASSRSHLSKQRGRTHDQCFAQYLIAGSRNDTEPDLTSSRMILGYAGPGK